jgi:fructosamine-3-kinase
MDGADLRHVVLGARRKLARLRRGSAPRSYSPGLPDGLTEELVETCCLRETDERPTEVGSLHLSPFKLSGGAYRVRIRTPSDRSVQWIYKDCRYAPADAPGLSVIPLKIGPQEFAIYRTATDNLKAFLPGVLHAEEVARGEHYRYLLEDLSLTHRKPDSPRELRRAAARVAQLHDLLTGWDMREPSPLVPYDATFVASVYERTRDLFAEYRRRGLGTVGVFLSQALVDIITDQALHERHPRTVVHGDLNVASLLSSRDDMKVIDWEWTGIGQPHLDVAMLLYDARPDVERSVLAAYVQANPSLSPAEHEVGYHWARTVMFTLKAAVVVAELLADHQGKTRVDRPAHVARLEGGATVSLQHLTKL